MSEPAVLLFDGVCNLCAGLVRWVITHDPGARVTFASLQSERGRHLLRSYGIDEDTDSMVLISGGHAYTRSTGALRLAALLQPPWNLARVFLAVPRPVRDLAYRVVAANRYRWFGRQDDCWIPTPELARRFVA